MEFRRRMSTADISAGLIKGNRRTLSKALTLAESRRLEDRALLFNLLEEIMPNTGHSIRVGISGLPGAGKSTLIESAGLMLIEQGYNVAVLR